MKNSGVCVLHKGNKNVFMYNGIELSVTSTKDSNTLGTIIRDKTLFINGANIATSSTDTDFHVINDELFFGDVNLSNPAECINITQADYNKLLKGVPVAGYKRYNKSAIYNIVDDVDQADIITYTIDNGVITFSDSTTAVVNNNTLYNNTSGDLTENELDFDATVHNTKCPFVTVNHFNPVVPVNGVITLDYFVDTQDNASLNYGKRDTTFTVIVKTKDGNTPTKRTTYAGRFTIETPAFNVGGETWFSVECIDSNGVGSAVQYFDVLVRDAIIPNHYVMQASDLETYGIAINDNDHAKALANKAALSNFFADVKSGEIDGSNGYNGVKMIEGIYWIDLHAIDGYGTRTYKVATVDTNSNSSTYRKITALADCTEQDVIDAGVFSTQKVNHAYLQLYTPVWPEVGNYFAVEGTGESSVPWQIEKGIIKNNKKYYVFSTCFDGDEIVFPDNFTVDLNKATIRALPAYDLDHGQILYLNGNKDTHIVNGTIIGTYNPQSYDWETNKRWVGSSCPNEWQGITRTNKARYCSFEDLTMLNSTGYDTAVGGDNGMYDVSVYLEDYFDSGGTNKYQDIYENGYFKEVKEDGTVGVSEICSITPPISLNENQREVKFGRHGYAGYYLGTHREIFFAFYNGNNFISLVKSCLYYNCKVPEGATSFRVVIYGTSGTDIPRSTNNGWLAAWRGNAQSINITYKNCTFKNYRTCAIAPTHCKGLCYDSCYFENIGMQRSPYAVTSMLADLEDGWQGCQNLTFMNNTCNKGSGSAQFFSIFCLGLNFLNNIGVTYTSEGGVSAGFVEGNDIITLNIAKTVSSIHPAIIYRNNTIGQCNISYTNDRETRRCSVIDQDKVEKILYMEDTTIKDKCSYMYLKLRNSMNGDVWND